MALPPAGGREDGLTGQDAAAFVRTHYGIEATRVRRLSTSDTVVDRVDTADGSFVLRRHGTHTEAEIASNLRWLDALRETEIRAPEPIRTVDGAFVREHCTLVRWLPGRLHHRSPRPVHFERLGRLMARMHEHVSGWTPDADFVRPPWGAAEIFCERGIAAPPSGDPWALVSETLAPVLRDAVARARPLLDGEERLLIHADLHLHNVLFAGGVACPFDFDDSGFGPLGYDVASAIGYHRLKPHWNESFVAFLGGYGSVRAVPDLTDLDTFILGRAAGLALWACSIAETVPSFREPLPRWMAHYEDELTRLMA